MHHAGAGEVRIALAETEVVTQVGEPAAAPSPVAEERIDESAQHERGSDERSILPALGSRAGDDRQRRIHENHLEQEDDHDADIVSSMVHQEISVLSEQAKR